MNFAKVFACKFVPMKITGENYKFKTCRCKQNGIRKCVVIKDLFKISAVNYYHKVLHLGCCSSPRSASRQRMIKRKISITADFCNNYKNRVKSRSSHPDVFCEKGVLRDFANFTGKHLCQSLFFNKVAGLACNFIKKETLAQVFSCEFCETSKNTVFYRTLL